jgi:hypothetical protein
MRWSGAETQAATPSLTTPALRFGHGREGNMAESYQGAGACGERHLLSLYVQCCRKETGMTAHRVAERLGGPLVLERIVESDLDLAEVVEGGLPVAAVESVIRSGTFSAGEIYALALPRRTLTHP